MQMNVDLIWDYWFPGIFFIFLGVVGIIMRSSGAKSAVKWNLQILGIAGKEQTYKIALLLGGIAFIIFGVLDLMGIIHFKQ
jgi:hypothetical protein